MSNINPETAALAQEIVEKANGDVTEILNSMALSLVSLGLVSLELGRKDAAMVAAEASILVSAVRKELEKESNEEG